MEMTKKERKEFDKVIKQILKLCDGLDEMLDRMACGEGNKSQPNLKQGYPKVMVSGEHYA